MNEASDLNPLLNLATTQIDLLQTGLGLAACIVMSFVLRSFYLNRSYSLTGKHHVGSILPILSLVVFMVIVVVKTSLALSLGLVGALSIVRFRTPIKEPEELVYLFLAIAIGLGYGSGHILLTTAVTAVILVVVYLFLSNTTQSGTTEYNLIVKWNDPDVHFKVLSKHVEKAANTLKLIRLETSPSEKSAVLLIEPKTEFDLDGLVAALNKEAPSLTATFFECKANW